MLLTLFIGLLTGCDPVRRVEQTVVLKISSVDDVESPSNVSIAIREFHQASQDDEEFERFNPKRREQMYPWTQHVNTDKSGRATIVYGRTMLDRSRGNVPPKSRYPLEGKAFNVKIMGSHGKTEELIVDMVQGATVEGRGHRITVEAITRAVYVDPNK